MERLKLRHNDSAIKSRHSRRSLAENLSKPVALDLQSLDKRERTVEQLKGFKSNLVLSGITTKIIWRRNHRQFLFLSCRQLQKQNFHQRGIIVSLLQRKSKGEKNRSDTRIHYKIACKTNAPIKVKRGRGYVLVAKI